MDQQLIFPTTLAANNSQKRLAFIAALLVLAPFIVVTRIGEVELPQIDSYIPVMDTVILVNGSITATLLFAQFSITRSPSLLVLAGGFLFTAVFIVPHALAFPGAFAPDGLLGGLQTPAWINEFWHLVFPLTVIAYALLKRAGGVKPIPHNA
jgi:two-component system, NarL family, sensor histidine kinase UhpB